MPCVMNMLKLLSDVLSRRTRLAFLNAQAALEALPRVIDLMGEELHWSKVRKDVEWKDTVQFLASMGLAKSKLNVTREDVLSGRAGEYDEHERRLYSRHGRCCRLIIQVILDAFRRMAHANDTHRCPQPIHLRVIQSLSLGRSPLSRLTRLPIDRTWVICVHRGCWHVYSPNLDQSSCIYHGLSAIVGCPNIPMEARSGSFDKILRDKRNR